MTQRVVLGLNLGHDRSACLLIDGRVRIAIAEERLSRTKHDIPLNHVGERYNHLPHRAIAYCLDTSGLSPQDLDLVVASTTYVLCPDGQRRNLTPSDVREQYPAFAATRIEVVGHHLAHAASAVSGVGANDAAVLVVDGGGSIVAFDRDNKPMEFERTTCFRWEDGKFEIAFRDTGGPPAYGNSLGDFYQLFTVYLGFGVGEEGKLMGMAGHHPRLPDWVPLAHFEEAIVVNPDGTHRVKEEFQYLEDGTFSPQLMEWFGPPRSAPTEANTTDSEIAASVQAVIECALLELARVAWAKSGKKSVLCVAGGVGLNCVANGRIVREGPYSQIFIQPAATDDGTALGNALLGWWMIGGRPDDYRFTSPYLGRCYPPAEVQDELDRFDEVIDVQTVDSPISAIVDDIVQGSIVALFEGASEFGPRALGHRSIVCDPRRKDLRDRLNAEVKHRELFRPFAPMVTAERASAFFALSVPSPYMLLTADVLQPSLIPAVTHVDGTARVQTVDAAHEPMLHRLLEAFEAAAGVPVLLNTSFNDREPIVETPADALRCFLRTGIDVLYLDGRRITKRDGAR